MIFPDYEPLFVEVYLDTLTDFYFYTTQEALDFISERFPTASINQNGAIMIEPGKSVGQLNYPAMDRYLSEQVNRLKPEVIELIQKKWCR